MKFYFARHGESEANLLHVISNRGYQHPLTDRGREQAAALAETLHDVPLSQIFTSPLRRAVETAQIVAQAHNLPFQVNDALREYDCGVLEGQGDPISWAIHEQTWHAWLIDGDYHVSPKGGETFYDIQARFVPFIEGLIGQYANTTAAILLMGHGGTYRTMLPLVLDNIDHAFALSHPIDNTTTILAEWQGDKLICTEWCSQPVE